MTAVATAALTAEQMVKIAREHVDSFGNGDWERLQAGLTADARYHELGTQREVEGPEEIVELFKGWKTAFPDAAGTVTSAVASGNTAALELTWTGTHTGPLVTAEGTIPASGKRQETPGGIFFTYEGVCGRDGACASVCPPGVTSTAVHVTAQTSAPSIALRGLSRVSATPVRSPRGERLQVLARRVADPGQLREGVEVAR